MSKNRIPKRADIVENKKNSIEQETPTEGSIPGRGASSRLGISRAPVPSNEIDSKLINEDK